MTFFGSLRAKMYDEKVREIIMEYGVDKIGAVLVNRREGPLEVENPVVGYEALISAGEAIVAEQENVNKVQLAHSYLSGAQLAGSRGSELRPVSN